MQNCYKNIVTEYKTEFREQNVKDILSQEGLLQGTKVGLCEAPIVRNLFLLLDKGKNLVRVQQIGLTRLEKLVAE